MDEKNINTSFDGVFEGREWIVTKNERGKVKVALCGDDEIDDMYMTRADWRIKDVKEVEVNKNIPDKVPNWKLYGSAMFLVRDLLNCECKGRYFICKNIPFKGVLICGTVVQLYTRLDKHVIVVDDGTSSIRCLIRPEDLAALQLSDEEKQNHTKIVDALKADPTDQYVRAKAIMMRATKNLVKNTPSFEDLNPGDIVTITGHLSEYYDSRYIFIKSIEKEPEESLCHLTHLERLLKLYTNDYEDL